MRVVLLTLCASAILAACSACYAEPIGSGDRWVSLVQTSNQEVWSGSERSPGVFDDHNAFTDLIRYGDDFYVTFREANGHVPGSDGRTAILRSSNNGDSWSRIADLRLDGYDLRDPKLTVDPQGRLMSYFTAANYGAGNPLDRRGFVSFYDPMADGFGPLVETQPSPGSDYMNTDSDWLWRWTWFDGVGYSTSERRTDLDGSTTSYLFSSADGLTIDTVGLVPDPPNVSENSIVFDAAGDMYILGRSRGGNNAYIGTATRAAGYTDIQWKPLVDGEGRHRRTGGPNLIVTPSGELLVGGRKYTDEGTTNGKNATVLAQITVDGTWRDLVELPSGGSDTSYPGLVLEDGTLYMSYYAGPASGGDPHIYFAEFDFQEFADGPEFNGLSGDINQDGVFAGDGSGPAESDDVSAFLAGYGARGLPGEANKFISYTQGDVNFDGSTDLGDAAEMRALLTAAGASPHALARVLALPEPGAMALSATGAAASAVVVGQRKLFRGRRSRCPIRCRGRLRR